MINPNRNLSEQKLFFGFFSGKLKPRNEETRHKEAIEEKAKSVYVEGFSFSDEDRSSTSLGQRQGSEINTKALSFTFSTNKVPSFREGWRKNRIFKGNCNFNLGFMPADRFVAVTGIMYEFSFF